MNIPEEDHDGLIFGGDDAQCIACLEMYIRPFVHWTGQRSEQNET